MNSIRQHIPGFVDGVDAKISDFETTNELLALDFVRSWAADLVQCEV